MNLNISNVLLATICVSNCLINSNNLSARVNNKDIQSQKKPNIIFILIDDLGKEWLDVYGAKNIKLPNINRLAQTGMTFNNVYSMPQCTPSRCCLLTGLYPGNNGMVDHWDVPRWGRGVHFDPTQYQAVWAREMKKIGYMTAAAGKWQIDDFRIEPNAMVEAGFDKWCMWTGYETGNKPSGKRYWNLYLIYDNKKAQTYHGKFGPDLVNDFVLDFITKNRHKPFFVYYPMLLTHSPYVTTPHEPNAKNVTEKHKAMTRYADFLIGKVVDKLIELKLRS
ncbi:sulfatase-like hydrolase/transferase [Lentisphaerota bacterium WC36G]